MNLFTINVTQTMLEQNQWPQKMLHSFRNYITCWQVLMVDQTYESEETLINQDEAYECSIIEETHLTTETGR